MKLFAILSGILWLGCACAAASAAKPSAAQQAQLQELRSRISKLEAATDHDVQTRGRVYAELRANEQQIAKLNTGLRVLDGSLAQAQARLVVLKQQQARAQSRMTAQKAALAAQMRAAYEQGQAPELQLLLNAQDPATLDRMLAYYQYMDRARAADIKVLRDELQQLADLNQQVQAQVTMLAGLKQQRGVALAKLMDSRDQRKQTLTTLDTRIHGSNARLAEMRRDENNLENLLSKLQQTLSDIPANLEGEHRFARLKGRLPWPVAGRIIQHFGAPLADGRLRAQGDLIAAALGTPVHAISYGRVVFADWLPHFGLLVIVDHGEGYMSIYAHNQSIYVHVGDWVQMGETIATLGDSGGQSQPALYFEIRHLKAALSPRDWCQRTRAGR